MVASSDFNFEEQERITQKVHSLVDIDEANIFYGVVFDEDMGDEIQVTVVATGLTLDNTQSTQLEIFVSDASSTHKVEAGTHEPAYAARRDIPQSIPTPKPPVQQTIEPAPSTAIITATTHRQQYSRLSTSPAKSLRYCMIFKAHSLIVVGFFFTVSQS